MNECIMRPATAALGEEVAPSVKDANRCEQLIPGGVVQTDIHVHELLLIPKRIFFCFVVCF